MNRGTERNKREHLFLFPFWGKSEEKGNRTEHTPLGVFPCSLPMQALFVPLVWWFGWLAVKSTQPTHRLDLLPKLAALADRCKWVEVCHQLLIGEPT